MLTSALVRAKPRQAIPALEAVCAHLPFPGHPAGRGRVNHRSPRSPHPCVRDGTRPLTRTTYALILGRSDRATCRRKTRGRLLRKLQISLGLALATAIVSVLSYMVAMPGSSYSGALKPLTADES